MRDLTPLFAEALSRNGSAKWSEITLVAVARVITSRVASAKLDWDLDAGEHWARVVANGEVIVLLWSLGPLAFVGSSWRQPLSDVLSAAEVVVEPVLNWDASVYTLSSDAVSSIFHRANLPDVVNLARFSANELWWATV